MSIQKIFDPETLRIYDITKPDAPELIFKYHERFDSVNSKVGPAYLTDTIKFYGLDAYQQLPGELNDYSIEKEDVLPFLQSDSFLLGYNNGFFQGGRYQRRNFFKEYQPVDWFFLIGYEFGFLIGLKWHREGKKITTPPFIDEDPSKITRPSRSMMARYKKKG